MKITPSGADPTGAFPAAILALFPPLSEAEQRTSLALYRLLVRGDAVTADRLAASAGAPTDEVERMLARWPNVQRGANGSVLGYGGLTIQPTRHRIHLGDRVVFGWCAWDTLFLPELLAQRARVQSNCPVCGKRVRLEVGPAGVAAGAEQLRISFVAPDRQEASQDIVNSFCRFVHFFATEEAATQWLSRHPGAVLATLDEAWALGQRRNRQRYPGLSFMRSVDPRQPGAATAGQAEV